MANAAGEAWVEDMLLSRMYEDEQGDIPESSISGAPGHEAAGTQCGDGDGVASTSIQGVAITPPSQTSGGTTNVTQLFVSTGGLPWAWSLGFARASSASSSSPSSGQQ